MKKIFYLLPVLLGLTPLYAQIDAGLFRYPDVSQSQIVFTYANDIWIMPKEGGNAVRLSSPPGEEAFPKFSPDGKDIAFTGNYDGNPDVYVLPATGGVPLRLTQHGYPDRTVDWTPDGKQVVFASTRESGKSRFNQFYTIPAAGGPYNKLPLAYAEFGSYSPDGQRMAVTYISTAFRTWKRYRGGMKASIQIFNFADQTSEKISTDNEAGDEFPMWHDNFIYFLSDRGPELRMNLWRFNTGTKKSEQLTHFKDYDVHFPSLGPEDIVFEAGAKLYLFRLSSQQLKEVKVNVITDKANLRPQLKQVQNYIQHAAISPDGSRALLEARGEIFSLPAEHGYVKNLTRSSGSAERAPAWSPDGKHIAYWSDQSGEYELWLMQAGKEQSATKLTSYGAGFRYNLFWSPDSKKLAFIDKALKIKIYDLTTRQTTDVDQSLRYSQGDLEGFTASWSRDSRWLTYSRDLANQYNAVFLYDYTQKKLHQATSGFYDCSKPVFDPDGKYLYCFTQQFFRPYYSDIDNTFIYANSTQIAAIPLKRSTPSALYARNDTVALKQEDKPKEEEKPETKDKAVDIDIDGFESRAEILPVPPGNYSNLSAVKGKVIFIRRANTGSGSESQPELKYYDTDKREQKTILQPASEYDLTADGKKLLAKSGSTWGIIDIGENKKLEKALRTTEMEMTVDPAQEWKQIFTDAWRLERDYFYDPNMHGTNWNQVRERYQKMLDGALTREDVNFVIGEMIAELNASHTYRGGGDLDAERTQSVGYLGVDWQADGKYYKIKKIIRGAAWDAEARSPLDRPGVDIKEGDYILAVNGVPLGTDQEPFAAFSNLSRKTVELTYNSTPSLNGAKTAVVETLSDEYRLRHLAWIEQYRKQVNEATNGQVGYIFVPSTGIDGQNELIRQFNGQWDKQGLIIDERFNNGGQIPDRFIELLERKPLAYWATRDGKAWSSPGKPHTGPKVMLINGWSGSGGDAFPDYFRKKGLGPLIGTRTWGGLIGLTGAPALIDGGTVTVPTFRMYNGDGSWFKEGHGVDPDIAVDEDLGAMAHGRDPQLEQAINTIKSQLKDKGFTPPKMPAYEKR
jgi:tricorn protease